MKASWLTKVISATCLLALTANAFAAEACYQSGSSLASCAVSWQTIFEDGNQLVHPGRAYEAGYFDGFVMGIAQAGNGKYFCPAQPFTQDQLSAIAAKYLRANPEQWGRLPDDLVKSALSSAFPCPRAKGKS